MEVLARAYTFTLIYTYTSQNTQNIDASCVRNFVPNFLQGMHLTNTVQDQSVNQSIDQWFISDNKAHIYTL